MEYCDFPIGKYRAFITSSYMDFDKSTKQIDSNIFYFESTQPVEDIVLKSCDVAIAHPKFGDNNKNVIWICYIGEEDNVLRIKYCVDEAPYKRWQTYHIPYTIADKCCLCFDSEIQGNKEKDTFEFVTKDSLPCLCYLRDNILYVMDLATGESNILVAENVIDMSLVRGSVAINGAYDMGLMVFFLMENKVYYKQRINNIWYDAEIVDFNTNNITLTDIKAFKTWDLRIGFQVLNSDGELYQYITDPRGLLDHRENLSMALLSDIQLLGIGYYDTKNQDEHIDMGFDLTSVVMIYGHSTLPISINNIEDLNNNWGTTIQIVFDYPNTIDNLQTTDFTLIDTNNNNFICRNISLSQDGLVLTLVFDDFNATYRATNTTLTYIVPQTGGLISPAGQQTNAFALTFVPTNLIDPGPPPVVSVMNNNASGEQIYVTFDKVLINGVLDSDIINHFTISVVEYNHVPEGTLITTTRVINNIDYNGSDDSLVFTLKQNISGAVGNVTITYDGTGGLRGVGGPVAAFNESFVPTGLTWKGNQNDVEHISMGMSHNIILTHITYHNTKTEEHINMGLNANFVLTDIHDL